MERLLYREGQLLSSADLRDAAERDDALRSLHVKHQHGTWGIALGLEVSPAPGGGAVIVGPGHAIDTEGRDLLLSHPRTKPVPSAVGPERFALIATHERPGRSGCGCGCGGGGGCGCGGHSSEEVGRMPERLTLSWRPLSQVAARAVVLAVVRVTGGLIDPPLDFRGRRYARRLWRPRLASGSTEGRSVWREWKEAGPDPLGLELDVDASDAAFRETPLYFAALAGPSEVPARRPLPTLRGPSETAACWTHRRSASSPTLTPTVSSSAC